MVHNIYEMEKLALYRQEEAYKDATQNRVSLRFKASASKVALFKKWLLTLRIYGG